MELAQIQQQELGDSEEEGAPDFDTDTDKDVFQMAREIILEDEDNSGQISEGGRRILSHPLDNLYPSDRVERKTPADIHVKYDIRKNGR